MNFRKLSIAVLFLTASGSLLYAQETKSDSTNREKKIEGVVIQGSTNRKTETAVLLEQKKAVVQKQAVSAEEISRKGISNVEQGLTKITGITTVEGRGLFVRGLEERYNYLLINGLGSPSNNPFQKIIALKQFPTDVVGKLNIYKTFNSNLYGDFAGATFDIETLTMDRPFSKVEFSVGVNTLSTFRDNFLISENADGMKGYLGLNSKDRRIPENIRDVRPSNLRFTAAQSQEYFKDSWNIDKVKAMPNTSIGFTTAQKIKAGEGNIGIMFSLNQSSEYSYREGAKNQFLDNGGQIVLNNDLNRKQYNYELESSALLGLGYKNRKTQINLNAIYLQNANNFIEDYFGYKNQQVQNKDIGFFRTNQLDISKFLDLQLTGSHKINERNSLKAGASYVLNNFQQPDRKIFEGSRKDNFGNQLSDDQIFTSYGGNNIIRQYLDVNSRFYGSAFGEYTLMLGEKGDRREFPFQINLGYNGFADLRKTSYRFIFGKPNGTPQSLILDRNKPQNRFNTDLQNGTFFFQEESDPYQAFSSIYQFVNAGYANINYKPNDTWDILLGARYESDLNLIRYSDLSSAKRNNIKKDQSLFLPSIAIKKAVNDRNNIRFAFSKTVTRPVLIERMPILYINPDNENILGNPLILNSENYNLDLKWEYYPSNKEMFAVNLFAKRINNAIERSFTTFSNSNGVTVTYYNSQKANLIGAEIEAMISFSRISESLRNFSLGTNATFMYSDVVRSADQLRLEGPQGLPTDQLHRRGLQGAAPYTINADLKYEMKKRNALTRTVSLVYNVTGSKIFAVGTSGTDNYYERPFNQLDIIFQEQITKNWNVKFAVQNILDNQYRIELGKNNYYPLNTNNNYQYTNFYRGTNLNMTVGYTF
ncbi:TonB-dependent receptor [Chryseobacterium sp. Leaf180]|uniref:TonB-dependent receptor plug domain-containing protein n=1 Tax=Chryseobacterium sp. Leaf180 TaxID=1736289 RepID=UPI0006F4610B|nr:TonB-dependent receptor plug domain-containing protein [Chryseobacterium sp. Leaf180]KQR92596.1 TonB-dependent receptor [Chryseobacterium sp. Leaf180]